MEEPSIFKKHENKIIIGSCVAAASLFIASFVFTATEVTTQMVAILILTMVGTIIFSIAIYIVYNKHSEYTHIPLLLFSTLAVGLSYAALCIAAISANSIG